MNGLMRVLGVSALLLMGAAQAFASPLVTSDVPVDSKHYQYLEKMEAMGFLTDMPNGIKPYSRLAVARMLAKVNPEGMQPYLKVYYDEMVDAYSDEIAYAIVHEPLTQVEKVGKKAKKAAKFHQEYYAQKYNYLVQEKLKLAQPKAFPSNVQFRSVELELSGQSMEQQAYKYRRTNASYQPLHGNNQGYRYGDGFNAVGSFNISGSLNNDVAMSLTPRFSYNKDDHGKAHLKEGYARTHLGNLSLTVGREAMNWGGSFAGNSLALGTNAASQTMIRLGLLEPIDTKDTWLRFLGKIDLNMFVSELEGNRRKRAKEAGMPGWKKECDSMKLIGLRMDVTPNDTFSFGMERMSMAKSLNKDWLIGHNAWSDDQWNDMGGFDARLKFPGVQFYGSAYGEDQAGGLPYKWAYNAGIYLPQLSKDGSWDAKIEAAKTNTVWYTHWTFVNGWSFRDNIVGDNMGNDARKLAANINNYLSNGDILSFNYNYTKWDNSYSINPTFQEYQIGYSHKLSQALTLDGAVGYAQIKNANYTSKTDKAKYISLGLKWIF